MGLFCFACNKMYKIFRMLIVDWFLLWTSYRLIRRSHKCRQFVRIIRYNGLFCEIQYLATKSGFCDGLLDFAQQLTAICMYACMCACMHALPTWNVGVCLSQATEEAAKTALLHNLNLPDLVTRHPVLNFAKRSLNWEYIYRESQSSVSCSSEAICTN